MKLSAELECYFNKAGWHNGWKFEVPDHIPSDHPAYLILHRYGGIHVQPEVVSGFECATADIQFQPLEHRSETVDKWQDLLSTHLIGFGLASKSYEQLWAASDNRIFTSNDVTDDFGFVGDCFNSSILNLLTGVRHRPMLPPGKSGLKYYGENYLNGDPRIYNWTKYVG